VYSGVTTSEAPGGWLCPRPYLVSRALIRLRLCFRPNYVEWLALV